MALSMDEQRMLAEIERRLAAEDPGLASRLSSFRRPGPKLTLRSPRVRIIGSVLTVALVAMVSLMVYAMIPLRTHSARIAGRPQATPANPVLTIPGASPGGAVKPTGSHTSASSTTTASIATQATSAGSRSSTSGTTITRPKATKPTTSPASAHAP